MKIKHYFGLAVIAAMTASCSSNEDLGTAGPGTGTNEAGVSYASITINLPTTSGTRAAGDPEFKPGDDNEYKVNDATLLIFKKGTETSENKFKFVEVVPLGNLEPWKKDNESTNGITTEATITAELKQVTVGEGGDYYALVILNNKDKDNKDKVSMPVSTTSTTDTYGTWNAAEKAKNLIDYEKGFYMANAPEFNAAGQEPTTLVQIKGIYRTKEEAQSKPGTTVHVERGLAKVTVGKNSTSTKDYFAEGGANATGSNYSSDKVQITNWALDVTNKKSFPVHVTSGLKDGTTSEGETVPAYAEIWSNNTAATPGTSRFVSQLTATGAFNRVYWGIDPNYSTEYTTPAECKGAFNILGNAEITGAVAKPQYCLENTFDIEHMQQGQTTRVIFKAKYAPQNDAGVSLAESDGTFYTIGNMTTILKEADLKTVVDNAATSVLPGCAVDYDANLKKEGSHVITLEDIKDATGTPLVAETEYNGKKGTVIVDEINAKLGLKAGVGINTYLQGVTYYIARIKHFGNDLTPWKAGDATYGKDNLKWLGRYGVLRNNWYDLTINTISGPGYPDVPEVKPTDPDDEDTKYISVSVKILDWAKRSHSYDL